jgi:uncharacterized protein
MDPQIRLHSIWQTLALHLIPGALITAFYFLIIPLVKNAGYPSLMAILLAILVILIPVELGILFYQGKMQTGKLSLNKVVLNRETIPLWQYFVLVPLLLVWCAAIFINLAPLDSYIIQNYFFWLPSWMTLSLTPETVSKYPASIIQITVIFAIAMNGIIGPIVEELYFRGYLLPRIPVSRYWAPLIGVLLFSLYHFFSPWQNITRILALIPMVYVVAWKRNIYLSIFTHCLLNTLGMGSLISLLAVY